MHIRRGKKTISLFGQTSSQTLFGEKNKKNEMFSP